MLFEDVSFGVFERARLGLIGVNGSGKSTLLKMMAGIETPDVGEVVLRRGLKVGYVAQDSLPIQKSLQQTETTCLQPVGALLKKSSSQ